MKKPTYALLALFACAVLPLSAADLSDLTWTTTDGRVTITNCDNAATGELVIPDIIEGNPVTSIGEYAFRKCRSLTSITIPNSVTSIGSNAFSTCSSLTSITIPDSVTSIGHSAFLFCASLTDITIPDSVTRIGGLAFTECSSLKSITIPGSVTSIANATFADCSSLKSITIGNGVTSLGSYAFRDCSSLTSITIPDSVTSIGHSAFLRCSSLKSITIGYGVTNIKGYAFAECNSLRAVTFLGSAPDVGIDPFNQVGGAIATVTAAKLSSFGSEGESWNGLTLRTLDQVVAELEEQLVKVTAERDAAISEKDAAISERDAAISEITETEVERDAVLADVKLAYDEVVGREGAAEEDLVEVTPTFMANTFDLLWTNSEDNQDTISMVMEFPEDTVTNPPSIAFESVKGSVLTINYKGSITTVNEPDIVFRSIEEVDFSQDLIDQLSDFNLFSVSIPDEGLFNGIAPFTVEAPNGSRYELTSMKMKMNVNDESKYSFLELEPFTEIFSSLSSKIAELEQGGGGQNLEQVLEQVTDARAGSVVINSSNGEAIISFNIEESEDLNTWQATGEKITKTVQLKDGKKFYRFALDK